MRELLLSVLVSMSCAAPPVPRAEAPSSARDELLRVCVPSGDEIAATYDPGCPPWGEVAWGRAPLTWTLATPPGCPVTPDVVEVGLRRAYGRLYRRLLRRDDEAVWPDVAVAACVDGLEGKSGATVHVWLPAGAARERRTHHAVVLVAEIADAVLAGRVAAHEVGHALGLAHDVADPGSLMAPKIWAVRRQDGSYAATASEQELRASDRRALRDLYLGGDR